MKIRDFFANETDLFESLFEITVVRRLSQYVLKVLCKKDGYYILFYDDGWSDDDLKTITVCFSTFSTYAWFENLPIKALLSI